jgi:hypothetical protein
VRGKLRELRIVEFGQKTPIALGGIGPLEDDEVPVGAMKAT